MENAPPPDTPGAQPAADLLASQGRQALGMLYEYLETAVDLPLAADRSARIARVGGRIKALCTIEQELILPFLVGEPPAQQARERLRQLQQSVESLAASPPAASDTDRQVAALTAAFREHLQLQRRDVLPRLHDTDLSAAASALQELKARLVQEEAPD